MLKEVSKKVLVVLIGIIVASLTVGLVEWIGHLAYPDNDFKVDMTRKEMSVVVANMPAMALLIVGIAWMFGCFLGCLVTRGMNKQIPLVAALTPGLLTMFGGIIMFIRIPHPVWFVVISLIIAGVGTYFGELKGREIQLGKLG